MRYPQHLAIQDALPESVVGQPPSLLSHRLHDLVPPAVAPSPTLPAADGFPPAALLGIAFLRCHDAPSHQELQETHTLSGAVPATHTGGPTTARRLTSRRRRGARPSRLHTAPESSWARRAPSCPQTLLRARQRKRCTRIRNCTRTRITLARTRTNTYTAPSEHAHSRADTATHPALPARQDS